MSAVAVAMIDRNRRVQFIGHGNLANAGRPRGVCLKTLGPGLPRLRRMSSLVSSFLKRMGTMAAAVAWLVSDMFFLWVYKYDMNIIVRNWKGICICNDYKL